MRLISPIVLAASFAHSALAVDSYIFLFNPELSSVRTSPLLSLDFTGSLIGNYDAASNPTGTLTRPGLFGGSGNQPIPTSINLAAEGNSVTRPSGRFRVDVDADTLLLNVSALNVDLLGGGQLTSTLSAGFIYDTFRTFAPNSLFPGNIPIRIPLGEIAITTLTAEQLAPIAPAVLTPLGQLRYSFAAAVPVLFSIEGDLLGNPAPLPPIPALLPLVGEIDLGIPAIQISWAFDQSQPLPPELLALIPAIENQPLPLPTILPPGQTANLILNQTVSSGLAGLSQEATLIANGSRRCDADFNNDGIVDETDLAGFLNAFESGTFAGDFNGDFFLDFFDYVAFISAFETPCGPT